jgi:hypothetical protein
VIFQKGFTIITTGKSEAKSGVGDYGLDFPMSFITVEIVTDSSGLYLLYESQG